ncbi:MULTISPECIES: hypothetical protein [Hymenobacter]|uniref:Uncharacterized protein n=1 Tax=Hymenobacter mucosus TaxID=1411120 RepID=A0A238WB07_9BACT|nr:MULTISPECIES: hypothetical protein [Hymenobacter]SNR43730.1 hypothetical protein SAMN06269173_102423 [Hymenobacter mucosus]
MTISEPRPNSFLLYLLTAAVVLSVGLNAFLLYRSADEEAQPTALADAEAELRMTQRLLAHCQDDHQRQDSLLVSLRAALPAAVPVAGP